MSPDLMLWPQADLPEDVVQCARTAQVHVSEEGILDVIDLMRAWRAHVEKLERDMPYPRSDRSVWGGYDVVAAYLIRDFLEVALETLFLADRTAVTALLAEVDERFQENTDVDAAGR